MKDQTVIILCGILCISALEAIALAYGFNGTMLRIVVIIIAAAIGITIPVPKILKGGTKNG